jgi:hypothetical protein
MIKRFHQINEEVSILRDLNFFKDQFSEFLDEYDLELKNPRLIKGVSRNED